MLQDRELLKAIVFYSKDIDLVWLYIQGMKVYQMRLTHLAIDLFEGALSKSIEQEHMCRLRLV